MDMRIAILCLGGLGGSSVAAAGLAARLAAGGHRVWVAAPHRPLRLPQLDGLTYVNVPAPAYHTFAEPLSHLALAGTLLRLVEEAEPDVVHVHYALPAAPMALLALRMTGRRALPALVVTLHGSDVTVLGRHAALRPLLLPVLERADAVTAVSRFLAGEAAALGLSRPVAVLPNLVDVDHFRPRRPAEFRSFLARPEEAVLIHVSNFRPVKAVLDVIRVFALVRRRRRVRLVLVGEGPDALRAREEVEALGAAAEVSFLGLRPDVAAILPAADVFLLPSLNESFGLAAAEAMACGVPVVASAVGGLPEVVVDGETGFLRPPGDVEAMAEAVLSLLDHDELRLRLGAAARARAELLFAPAAVLPRYEALYREVAPLRPPGGRLGEGIPPAEAGGRDGEGAGGTRRPCPAKEGGSRWT